MVLPCTAPRDPYRTAAPLHTADVDVASAHASTDGFDGPAMPQWDGLSRTWARLTRARTLGPGHYLKVHDSKVHDSKVQDFKVHDSKVHDSKVQDIKGP